MVNKQHTQSHNHSALLLEINDLLAKIYKEQEMVVMANSQLVEPPHQGPARNKTLRELKTRMENLPDFDEQMENNPMFRRTYVRLLAGLKL